MQVAAHLREIAPDPHSLIGACLLALSVVVPVSATMAVRERYAGSDAWSYDDCGTDVDVTAEFGGHVQIRAGAGQDASAFFVQDNYWYRETHVRRSDGKSATIAGNGLLKETRATRIEGSVFTFTAVNAGQLFTFRDGDGAILLRDRGALVVTILFDTLGDDVPGGDFLGFVDRSVHGQFPGLSVDLCEYWTSP